MVAPVLSTALTVQPKERRPTTPPLPRKPPAGASRPAPATCQLRISPAFSVAPSYRSICPAGDALHGARIGDAVKEHRPYARRADLLRQLCQLRGRGFAVVGPS